MDIVDIIFKDTSFENAEIIKGFFRKKINIDKSTFVLIDEILDANKKINQKIKNKK
jgi:hypothetical protein